MLEFGIFVRRFTNEFIFQKIEETMKTIYEDVKAREVSSFRRLGGERG